MDALDTRVGFRGQFTHNFDHNLRISFHNLDSIILKPEPLVRPS
jgi:hypothetical protein